MCHRLCAESRGHVRREHQERLRGRGRNLVCVKSWDPTPSLKHLRGSFDDIWASTVTVRAPVLKFVASKRHFIPFLRTFCMFVFAALLNASFSSWVSQFPLDLQPLGRMRNKSLYHFFPWDVRGKNLHFPKQINSFLVCAASVCLDAQGCPI